MEDTTGQSSMDQLQVCLKRFNLSPEDIKRQCSEVHAAEIASDLCDWRQACPFLGISSDDVTVIDRNHPNDEKAKRKACLDKWMSTSGRKNATYEMLLRALESVKRRDLVDKVLELVKETCRDDGLDSDSSNDIKHEDMRFLCGCGKCSLDSFIKSGCPNPWEKSKFPLLNFKHMNRRARLELLGRLTEESDELKEKFASVVMDVCQSLENLNVNLKAIVLFVLLKQKFTDLEEEKRLELQEKLRNAQDVYDVMILLTTYFMSWFNHPLFGSIVKKFIPNDTSYQNYVENDFLTFMQRSLFEVPNSLDSEELKGTGKFVLKVDVSQPKSSVKGEIMLPLRRHLSKNLGIAIDSFDICDYDKGCLQFTVAVPLLLLHAIFPIPPGVIDHLSDFCFNGTQIKSISFEQHFHTVPKKDNVKNQTSHDSSKTSLSEIMNQFASLVIELYTSMTLKEDKQGTAEQDNEGQIKKDEEKNQHEDNSNDSRNFKAKNVPAQDCVTISDEAKQYLSQLYIFKLRKLDSQEQLLPDEDIKKISTTFDLVLLLSSYWSFYNYFLLARLIRGKYGSSEAKEKLTHYKCCLDELPVTELPPLIQPFANSNSFHIDDLLIIKLKTDVLKLQAEVLHEIHITIAIQLELEPHALLLKQIRKETNELEFLVHKCAVNNFKFFDITQDQISSIKFKGRTIKCSELKVCGTDSDKDSGFTTCSSIMSSDNISSVVSSDDTCIFSEHTEHISIKRKKIIPPKRSQSTESTLSDEEEKQKNISPNYFFRSTSIQRSTSTSDHDTIVPTNPSPLNMSPLELSAVTLLPNTSPNVFQQDTYKMIHPLSLEVPILAHVPKPRYESVVPNKEDNEVFKPESDNWQQTFVVCQQSKRSKTFKDSEAWKTNFQSRLERTLLQETGVTEELTIDNYKEKFYYLLCYEESDSIRLLTKKCDGTYKLLLHRKIAGRYVAVIEGMSIDQIQYAAQASEAVFILDNITRKEICKADILLSNFHKIGEQFLVLLSSSALNALDKDLNIRKIKERGALIYAQFEVKHMYFNTLHKAVVNIPCSMIYKVLPSTPPVVTNTGDLHKEVSPYIQTSIELSLNSDRQFEALQLILQRSSDVPIILSGPFGSGKSRVLVRAVFELIEKGIANIHTHTNILVCAHHESTLNKMTTVLDGAIKGKQEVKVIKILRGYAKSFTTLSGIIHSSMDIFSEEIKKRDYFCNRVLLIFTTYIMSVHITSLLAPRFFCFTHILLDEAAQVREPEAIAALSLADANTKVVIAGDIKQDGPAVVVIGETAREYGLKTSLLERLEYRYDEIERMDHLVHLNVNYRCHPLLTKFLANTIYKYPIKSSKVTSTNLHPKASKCPCFFHCCHLKSNTPATEEEVMAKEAEAVVGQIKEFFDKWPEYHFSFDDVFVVSSARSQLNLIETYLMKAGVYKATLKLKPSYTIQGHECHSVFISTFEHLEENGLSRNPTKTLVQPGIFNTVLSRSRQLVIAIGNPFTLLKTEQTMNSNPQCWKEYLRFCLENDTLTYSEDVEGIDSVLKAHVGMTPPSQFVSDETLSISCDEAATINSTCSSKARSQKQKLFRQEIKLGQDLMKTTEGKNSDQFIKHDSKEISSKRSNKKVSATQAIQKQELSDLTLGKEESKTHRSTPSILSTHISACMEKEAMPKQSSKQIITSKYTQHTLQVKRESYQDKGKKRTKEQSELDGKQFTLKDKKQECDFAAQQLLHVPSTERTLLPYVEHVYEKGCAKKYEKKKKREIRTLSLEEFHQFVSPSLEIKNNELKRTSFATKDISYASALKGPKRTPSY